MDEDDYVYLSTGHGSTAEGPSRKRKARPIGFHNPRPVSRKDRKRIAGLHTPTA